MYNTKQHICIIVTIVSASISCCCAPVSAWSNGGYSDGPEDVRYGTHDWIAEHALDFLPSDERQYIDDNLNWYLYGTELPDNSRPEDGIGDTSRHHVYFYENGSLMDDASAVRSQDIYNDTLAFLKEGDHANASKHAGIMTHYIADVAVFGHVTGKKTDWGAEVHHSDYESYVQRRTVGYVSEAFDPYIGFDGSLEIVTAYDATILIANDTTFDAGSEGVGARGWIRITTGAIPHSGTSAANRSILRSTLLQASFMHSTTRHVVSSAVISTEMAGSHQPMLLWCLEWRQAESTATM